MSAATIAPVSITSAKDRKRLEDLLTVDDAAKFFDCTPLTVRRMIARGDLRAYRVGRLIRIKPTDLEKALKPVTNAAMLRGDDVA